MSLSLVQSRALLGLEAASVTVEVHLANGLPSFTLVGLAETEVKEARERVRSAIQNAGLEFPNNKKIRWSQAFFGQNEQGNHGRHGYLSQKYSAVQAISVGAPTQHQNPSSLREAQKSLVTAHWQAPPAYRSCSRALVLRIELQ